jgi:hypothetical protein
VVSEDRFGDPVPLHLLVGLISELGHDLAKVEYVVVEALVVTVKMLDGSSVIHEVIRDDEPSSF